MPTSLFYRQANQSIQIAARRRSSRPTLLVSTRVFLGAVLGHAICAAISVIGGKLIAGRISQQWVTGLGDTHLIVFGIVTAMEMA
ncbi:MAG: TMEM165/GDT1 family protein [Thermosynechococcaceae cyanobacterium]